jgi:hypothetical protein
MRVIHLKLTSSMYIIRLRKFHRQQFYSTSDLHIQLLCTALLLLLLTSWTVWSWKVHSHRPSVQDILDRHFRYKKLQTPTSSSILWTALTQKSYPIITIFFINVYTVLFLFNNVIYVFILYDYVFSLYVYAWLPWLRFFRAFSSVVRQMPG